LSGNGHEEATRTKRVVVEEPRGPDYPRHRIEPGERVSLAKIDPEETEHYRKKKM
jgi:hypothetical protein